MKISDFYRKVDTSVAVAKIVFNSFKSQYPIKTISEFAETRSGGTPQRGISEYYNGNIPWIKSGELNDGIISSAEEFITEKGLNSSAATIFPKGTLVVALYGATAGKVGILDFDSASNQAVCAISPNESLLRDYLFWFLRQHRFEYLTISKGGAQPNISQNVVKKTEVPIPPKDIQKQVIDFLSSIEVNKKVDFNSGFAELKNEINHFFKINTVTTELENRFHHQHSLLTKLRQAILREAVRGQLVPQDPNDEPASELLKRIKAEKKQLLAQGKTRKEKSLPPITAEEIPFGLPRGWVWCRLGEIVSVLGDGLHGTPQYTNDGEYYFINGNNLINGKIEIKYNTKRVSVIEYEKYKKDMNTNSVLVSINGTLGNLAFFQNEKIILGKSACYFNLMEGINKYYVGYIIKSEYFLKYAVDVASETTIKNVSLKSMRYLPIPLPSMAEQQRIVNKINFLFASCDLLEKQIKENAQHSESLLQAVLKEAFEGK